jgi:hypothetical protein
MDYNVKRLIIISIVMLIIWGSLLTFWYIKADEVSKDPCRICSERMGDKVICYTSGATKTFYPNGTAIIDISRIDYALP